MVPRLSVACLSITQKKNQEQQQPARKKNRPRCPVSIVTNQHNTTRHALADKRTDLEVQGRADGAVVREFHAVGHLVPAPAEGVRLAWFIVIGVWGGGVQGWKWVYTYMYTCT